MASTRRGFLQQGLLTGTSILFTGSGLQANENENENNLVAMPDIDVVPKVLDLSPARWIWLPSQRTLPNSILLFRKKINLSNKPIKATGWIIGESRYKLYANGDRVQFGPAPADPRWAEADPVDLKKYLQAGENIIGAEVLFYGFGDGTWPIGKPGFIFKMEIEYDNGNKENIISDDTWEVKVAQSWRPGQYKRWYLRALQEEFDARFYPFGWNKPGDNSKGWLAAILLDGAADKPALATNSRDYLNDSSGNSKQCELRARSVKMLKEEMIPVMKLTEQFWLRWKHSPEEYFQFLLPANNCFDTAGDNVAINENDVYIINFSDDRSVVLTFELKEQHVGFPYFTIDAPEGTIIELLVHEAHAPGTDVLINSHFNSWTRFICRQGVNHFETFDYESFRWLQLHIRNAKGQVKISQPGIRRRVYDWEHKPILKVNDAKLQQLIDASWNTVYNCCQETIVDGMARERQQYSGDVGHIIHALLYGMDAREMVARYLVTYSQGITSQGYFLDCWPAYDRLARLPQRELGMTPWGPVVDHGVGFNFDCFYYYRYTGDKDALKEVFPRLLRFYQYLLSIKKKDDLVPVEDIGVPSVWIDHDAYLQQRHKECAFNLYIAAMLKHAFASLCIVFDRKDFSLQAIEQSNKILKAVLKKYWSEKQGAFVNNLPWAAREGGTRMCDRSLATAILFDMKPGYNDSMAKILASKPADLGISYPANAGWRYWALAKQGYTEIVLNEFRERWYHIPSVLQNNTLAETWEVKPDSNNQWSHCPVAPLYFMYMNIAGIEPLQTGYKQVLIQPRLEGLGNLDIHYHTIQGKIEMHLVQQGNNLKGNIIIPKGVKAELRWKGSNISLTEGSNEISV